MNLTIDRKKWWRGKGKEESSLLKKDGRMCCLGFYCRKLGYTKKDIYLKRTPESVCNFRENLNSLVTVDNRIKSNNFACTELMVANDNILINDREREISITKWMKQIKVKVKFIN